MVTEEVLENVQSDEPEHGASVPEQAKEVDEVHEAKDEKQADASKKTLNEFDLEELVRQDVSFIMIENHRYARWLPAGSCFYYKEIFTCSDLEELLLELYKDVIRRDYKITHVKNCAKLLMHGSWTLISNTNSRNFVCLKNGYLDLSKTECAPLFSYGPEYLENPCHTFILQANGCGYPYTWAFYRQMSCPKMDEFLRQITDGDPILTARIWQVLGYLLTPANEKCWFLFQGVTNSGKSVLGNLIRYFYPLTQIENLDIEQLGRNTATSHLVDKSINLSMDLPNQVLPPAAVRTIKMISGQDDVTVQSASGKFRSYKLNCRFLFATNHPLILKGRDDALEDRIVCIPFRRSIPKAYQNPYLLQDLLSEADRILHKALGYYQLLRQNNFRFEGHGDCRYAPDIHYVVNMGEDARDHILEFVDEKCQLVRDHNKYTFTEDLYYAYHLFCRDNGYTPVNDKGAFSRNLNQCFKGRIEKKKIRAGKQALNGYSGIILNDAAVVPDPDQMV